MNMPLAYKSAGRIHVLDMSQIVSLEFYQPAPHVAHAVIVRLSNGQSCTVHDGVNEVAYRRLWKLGKLTETGRSELTL